MKVYKSRFYFFSNSVSQRLLVRATCNAAGFFAPVRSSPTSTPGWTASSFPQALRCPPPARPPPTPLQPPPLSARPPGPPGPLRWSAWSVCWLAGASPGSPFPANSRRIWRNGVRQKLKEVNCNTVHRQRERLSDSVGRHPHPPTFCINNP